MLQLFYACFFWATGTAVAFFPLYLRRLGLTGTEVAMMLSIAPVFHLGIPPAWGWIADRTRRPDIVLRIVCLGACLFMVPLVFVRTLPALALVFAAHQAFAVPIIGLTDSLALARVRQGADYGRIRVWGSIAFVMATFVAGKLLTWRGRADADPLVPAILAGAFALAFATALGLRGQGELERPHARDVSALLRDRRFLFLLVIAPLHWASAAPYHGFLGILLGDRHFAPSVVGYSFVISVSAEVLALYFFRRLRARFSLTALLTVTFAVTAVRWWLTATLQSAAWLLPLQAAHGLTFGVFWGCAMSWLAECVPARLRATGQTVFTGVMYGIGNTVGVMGSGALYDRFHGAEAAFKVAAGVELVALALVLLFGRKREPVAAA